MRELAILIFQTLDGVIQAPSVPEEDRSNGFTLGGWAQANWEEVMEYVIPEAMSEPYDLLLGRTTYELLAKNFAHVDDDNPVASMLNEAKKYVVSSSQVELSWNNSQQISRDIVEEIKQLKQQSGPLIQVHGSWELVQLLLEYNLVDEFRLWTFPIVLGQGKRLFSGEAGPFKLQLIKHAVSSGGVIMSIYRRIN